MSDSGQDVPYVHRFALSDTPDECTVEQEVPPELLASTALKITDWKKAQLDDRNISQILESIALGQRPTAWQVETSKLDKRFFKKWKKFRIEDGVLLRESVQHGQTIKQLVVPEKLRTDMFKAYHDDLGHEGPPHT